MAEIKVNIKGDDEDLKRKFRESSAEARHFQAEVTKSLEALKAAGQNVVSESGLGGIAKMLGAGGAGGMAVEFSSRLVQGFKDAIGAALDFQGKVGRLRSALGPAFAGQAESLVNWVQSVSAAFGGLERNFPIFEALIRGHMVPEEAKTALVEIQNAAKATGADIEELGLAFAEMKERGQVPERFWKQFPMLSPIAQGLGGGQSPTADWMLKTLLPSIAPGGLEAPGRLRAQGSVAGQLAATTEEFQKSMRELGTELLPSVNMGMRALKDSMPAVTEAFKKIGGNLKAVTEQAEKHGGDIAGVSRFMERWAYTLSPMPHLLGIPRPDVHTFDLWGALGKMFSGDISGWTRKMDLTADKHLEAADKLSRALNPH